MLIEVAVGVIESPLLVAARIVEELERIGKEQKRDIFLLRVDLRADENGEA